MTFVALPSKDPEGVKSYGINWLSFIETVWNPNREYELNTVIRPTARNGKEYKCTTAGESLGKEPTWPTTIGVTVADGSTVWTCQANTDAAIDDISASYWDVSDISIGDGAATTTIALVGTVTPSAPTNGASNTVATFYGGTVGTDGVVTNRIKTVGGEVYDRTFNIPIEEN